TVTIRSRFRPPAPARFIAWHCRSRNIKVLTSRRERFGRSLFFALESGFPSLDKVGIGNLLQAVISLTAVRGATLFRSHDARSCGSARFHQSPGGKNLWRFC